MKFLLPLLVIVLVPLLLRPLRIGIQKRSKSLTPRQQNIRALMLWAGLAVAWVAVYLVFRSN
jgi:hypothetical protein